MAMSTADIEAAIISITDQKDDLRKSFDILKSFSPSIASITLQWKDIEGHFSSIEKPIKERLREFKNLDSSSVVENSTADPPVPKVEDEEGQEVQPRPELKALCLKMDGKGLLSFIVKNRKDIVLIRRELVPALLSAADPVALVLDSLETSLQSKDTIIKELRRTWYSCSTILVCLKRLSLEIKPQDTGRAMEIATKWKEINKNIEGDKSILVLSFFQLVAVFGLIKSFEDDEILDLIVQVGWSEEIGDLYRSSALEEKVPYLVDKLINCGEHLVAAKFVLAFNLTDKYPPAVLLKTYVHKAKMKAREMRRLANSSLQSLIASAEKEIAELKAVAKTVEYYKLESFFHFEDLEKRIMRLEKQLVIDKATKTRKPATSNAATAHSGSNKRRRPSTSATVLSAREREQNNHMQLGRADRSSYVGFDGSNNLNAAPSIYIHGNSSLPANYFGFGPLLGPPCYDRMAMNGSYMAGLPAPYNPYFNPLLRPWS